ncbi:glycosyltransferase family 2 protein [Klebsiella oxytoca]
MNNDMIAVIMPAYNCQKTLKRAVDSVLLQTYSKWHLYIINDKSEEDIEDILRIYKKNKNISVIYNEVNLGAAESRNIGLRLSSEDYIAFIDSDDYWHPDKLIKQMSLLEQGCDIVISNYNYISKKSHKIIYNKDEIDLDSFVKKKIRVCFSSLLHKRVSNLHFEKVGHEDFLYIYNLLKVYKKIKIETHILVDYYDIINSLSSNKKKAAKWHYALLNRIFHGDKLKVYYYFLFYMINGIAFKLKNK